MTLPGLTSEKWLRRHWPLVGLLLVLTFMVHSVALASDYQLAGNALSTEQISIQSTDSNGVASNDAPKRPCDADHNVSMATGQNRFESLVTIDVTERLLAPPASAPLSDPSTAPPPFGVLLRTLLQVFLI